MNDAPNLEIAPQIAYLLQAIAPKILGFTQQDEDDNMADLFDNPMGLVGFEFVEFAAPVAGVLEPVF